jgi:hypothetical protein
VAATVGSNAASVYGRGVDVARRLADGYGIRAAFFWQPFLYSRQSDEVPPGELWRTDPDAWRRATAIARSKLGPSVVDLGAALDSVKAPIMYDLIHTNELGARVMARALYERLTPTLRQLYRSKGT